jgi:hypothetical protein
VKSQENVSDCCFCYLIWRARFSNCGEYWKYQ